MAMEEVNPVLSGGKSGGGFLGSVLGGLAGLGAAIAAIPSDGLSLAALGPSAGLIGAGSSVGNIVGNVADAPEAASAVPSVQVIQSGDKMSAMNKAPEVQMATMQNAKNLLSTSNLPNAMDYMNHIDNAQAKLKQQLGGNSFLG